MKQKKNSFTTPEGYFDSFTDNLMAKLSNEETITPKNEGFKVPAGYFDSLNEKIKTRLNEEEHKVIQLKSYKKYYAIAASVAAILFVFLGFQLNKSEPITFDSIAATDIDNYFEYNELDLTSFDIAQEYSLDELEIKDIINNSFTNESVIDYLDNSIDNFEELNLNDNE